MNFTSVLGMRGRLCLALVYLSMASSGIADTIPTMFSRKPEWRIGVDVSPAWVPATNDFLGGYNPRDKRINATLSGDVRADFSFNPSTRQGILYPGLYQGLGIGVNTFFANSLLGTPVSAYVYQGAPIIHLNSRLWLGYEWQFGVAFGWKHYDADTADTNSAVSTPVTAHMGVGLKFHYDLTDRWQLSFGLSARHYSNGNTSWPNAGVNSIGATIGVAYTFNPMPKAPASNTELETEADRHGWFYDITAFCSWRKRVISVGDPPEPQLCPGRFGILGVQFSPMFKLNRWAAAGPALEMQWDESAGLEQYWVDGTFGDEIKFRKPPFGKRIGIGLSAHAELTMPIFSVNIGLGYNALNPKGNKAFYQMLTLKTFITRHIYINTGYRIAAFKHPQNLMIGIGVRL